MFFCNVLHTFTSCPEPRATAAKGRASSWSSQSLLFRLLEPRQPLHETHGWHLIEPAQCVPLSWQGDLLRIGVSSACSIRSPSRFPSEVRQIFARFRTSTYTSNRQAKLLRSIWRQQCPCDGRSTCPWTSASVNRVIGIARVRSHSSHSSHAPPPPPPPPQIVFSHQLGGVGGVGGVGGGVVGGSVGG